MNIEELDILKELSEQTYFGDFPFLYYADLIGKLLTAYEKEKEKNKEYTMKINNLISQIESAIDFMKTDKLKIKVDMYQQKEEAEIEFNKYALVVLKKMLQELLEGRK